MENRCPECSGILKFEISVRSQVITCESCGWSAACTYFSPMELDEKDYRIYAGKNLNPAKKQLSAVSHICGINYPETYRRFRSDNFLLYEGKAKNIFAVKKLLDEADVTHYIIPDFKY